MKDDMKDLRSFLSSPSRNLFVHFGTIEAYVRKGHHMVEGELTKTFDLANFENQAKRRGKGEFRSLLPKLKKELRSNPNATEIQGIFVESVLNDRLAASLPSMGFRRVAGDPPCFYMSLGRVK